ncbi:Amino acid/polyamine transporter I [Metarhizium album ARSEF 1941]|uniref:Amino acid/polyamine transporter I n=1 Tax=Metarhizium album (strain ARSEF 1941) TaxID=1081103 RepID=A0A0B2WPJ2_METAS|nr:Amino acid/polyamine transporter I [Metarhizium album ARSEF 1941]KHN97961.1 Amino acid/polyamine transporter I [Metarhizium album ARSEF 1941]
MCAYLPIRGSIFQLARRFVDPALGFAMGWTYLYAGIMLVCVEYSAVATVMQYWNQSIDPAVWIAMAMAICIFLNVMPVKFRHWKDGNAMHSYYAEGAAGLFLGWWKAILYAGFTISGPDLIALGMGEIQNPRRTIPRVAKLVFYRVVGLYVTGALAVGILCSSRDERLMGAIEDHVAGSAASSWVIGIQNLGITGLPDLINAVILLSGMSCGKAYLYSSSRTLYGLARANQAPKFLVRCTKAGVPIYCVALVSLVTCITLLVTANSAVEVFNWSADLTTTGLIATYTSMLVVFVFWYRERSRQNLQSSALPYVAPFQPYWAFSALVVGVAALVFIGFDPFAPFKARGFITGYSCIFYTAVLYFGRKVLRGTSIVGPGAADLLSGKAEVDEECRVWEEGGVEENYKARLMEMPFWRKVLGETVAVDDTWKWRRTGGQGQNSYIGSKT